MKMGENKVGLFLALKSNSEKKKEIMYLWWKNFSLFHD